MDCLVCLTSHKLSRGRLVRSRLAWGLPVHSHVCRGPYLPTGDQWSGVWVIQEAGLGYKNDEKEDGLPAWWQWGAPCVFGTFHPLGLGSFSTHQTKPFH